MNPDLPAMLDLALARGFRALVLTNAMKPMHKMKPALLALRERYRRPADDPRLDRPLRPRRARGRARPAQLAADDRRPHMAGRQWLCRRVASRRLSGETEAEIAPRLCRGCSPSSASRSTPHDPVALTIFPEMDATADVPEITEACWGILGKSPDSVMCASSRMVVKFKGAATPTVIACTLLPYDPHFDLGPSLRRRARPGAAQPSALRQVLRPRRRRLQPELGD